MDRYPGAPIGLFVFCVESTEHPEEAWVVEPTKEATFPYREQVIKSGLPVM